MLRLHSSGLSCFHLNRTNMNAESLNPFVMSKKLREYRKANYELSIRNPHEIKVRRLLKRKGVLFHPQLVFRNCIFDFFVMEKGVAIEVDGTTHNPEEDQKRDAYLFDTYGIITIRVKNSDMEAANKAVEAVRLFKRWPDRLTDLGKPIPKWLTRKMKFVKVRKSKQTRRIRSKLKALWKSDGKNLPIRRWKY
jgi:very-short-patch-repair endonuclease